ncbi:ricin-type beta-trefoil lectin domain protein [Micromonospora sp. DT81.3]|uniref:ricin-type beta-trefoil lectin domain protein n=1 Tax=Micromonospora sp. DT81.3 TaxID=3416523 RepID=UPI003CEAB1CD
MPRYVRLLSAALSVLLASTAAVALFPSAALAAVPTTTQGPALGLLDPVTYQPAAFPDGTVGSACEVAAWSRNCHDLLVDESARTLTYVYATEWKTFVGSTYSINLTTGAGASGGRVSQLPQRRCAELAIHNDYESDGTDGDYVYRVSDGVRVSADAAFPSTLWHLSPDCRFVYDSAGRLFTATGEPRGTFASAAVNRVRTSDTGRVVAYETATGLFVINLDLGRTLRVDVVDNLNGGTAPAGAIGGFSLGQTGRTIAFSSDAILAGAPGTATAARQVYTRDIDWRPQAITGVGGKCVDVDNGSSANGTKVQLWDCASFNAAQQTFVPRSDGTLRTLGKCLDVSDFGTSNGSRVHLWDCSGGANQKWKVNTDGSIVNPVSGRCLDADGTANGTRLQLWDCAGSANQQWSTPPVTGVVTGLAGKCLTSEIDVAGAQPANGDPVTVWGCVGDDPQTWTHYNDGTLRSFGKCLDVSNFGTSNGSLVHLWDCASDSLNNGNQEWIAKSDGSLVNVTSGRCLDLIGPSSDNGTRLHLWDCHGGVSQKWNLPDVA